MNLYLDLFQIDEHPQDYMKSLGITYEHATPQSISEQWWFWNCSNVPEPLPGPLYVLKKEPKEAIGHGLSPSLAEKLTKYSQSDFKKLCQLLYVRLVDSNTLLGYLHSKGLIDSNDEDVITANRDLLANVKNKLMDSSHV
jgi:hypothetical protein